jgi:hypothetical protein
MWFARLTDTHPQWSFLEDPVGTTKRAAQLGKTIRLGEPINTGPNSTWHQLTWEGGEGQDIWSDNQMYQWGDADVLTQSGKMRLWPGWQSWMKLETMGRPRRLVLQQGSRSDTALAALQADINSSVLYAATGDRDPFEPRAAVYYLYQIHPNYTPGDSRAVQYLGANTDPFRFISPANGDDGLANVQFIATSARFYVFVENAQSFTQDTGAPTATAANFEFQPDSAKDFASGFYYLHGNRLMKRVGKPPYGVIGTHTVVKALKSAVWCRGLEVWNNRLYFGAMYPNGRSAVFVSDGATSTKAFDLPQQAQIFKMRAVAGALYLLTQQTSDVHAGNAPAATWRNVVQQVWRYDGRGLKKLWQQGEFSDGHNNWASDICDWNGWVVWGRQGTLDAQERANLVFYDPVRDSIVRGPHMDTNLLNIGAEFGRGLWIHSIATWHNTLAVFFKDDTEYGSTAKRPGMLATMRPTAYPKNDLRWNTVDGVGDAPQFAADITDTVSATVCSSEYHGTDDVATELKTWLNVRVRARLSTFTARLKCYVMHPKGDETADVNDATLIGTLTWDGTGGTTSAGSQSDYADYVWPIKDALGAYFKTQKIQVFFVLENTATGSWEDTGTPMLDDVAVQWTVSPKKRRQWQVRVPVTEAQATLAGAANGLTTADTLAQKLEDLYFEGNIVKFWEAASSTATPADGDYVEVKIEDFQRQQARVASDETGNIGYVTLTLVENVID